MKCLKLKIIFALMSTAQLMACATTPPAPITDLIPQPNLTEKISSELLRLAPPKNCRVIGCSGMRSDPQHYVCIGEFSVISREYAESLFRESIGKIKAPESRIDFTAEEGMGSNILGAFLGGQGGGLAGAAIGTSSQRLQFTLN